MTTAPAWLVPGVYAFTEFRGIRGIFVRVERVEEDGVLLYGDTEAMAMDAFLKTHFGPVEHSEHPFIPFYPPRREPKTMSNDQTPISESDRPTTFRDDPPKPKKTKTGEEPAHKSGDKPDEPEEKQVKV
jgi:hypothetical protein